MIIHNDPDLLDEIDKATDGTTMLCRIANSHSFKIDTALLIKVDDNYIDSLEYPSIHTRAALIQGERSMSLIIMLKIGDRIFNTAYDFYDRQPRNLVALIDLANQADLPIHFVSKHKHKIRSLKNHLKPIAARFLSLSNFLPEWEEATFLADLAAFYKDYDSTEALWDRLCKDHPLNKGIEGDSDPIPPTMIGKGKSVIL